MSVVDALNIEYSSIIEFMKENKQPSYESDLNRHFKKILVLSAASYFENEIQETLIDFVSSASENNTKLINFLKKKAIGMQYHTYFSWGEKNDPDKPGNNANSFFALFGNDFRQKAKEDVKKSTDLDKSIKAFLEIGHLRNILVHSNFASFNFDTKTTEEIYKLYKVACPFLDYLKQELI